VFWSGPRPRVLRRWRHARSASEFVVVPSFGVTDPNVPITVQIARLGGLLMDGIKQGRLPDVVNFYDTPRCHPCCA
jgi:hypothetical protein